MKTNSELLLAYKKANKERREKIFIKAGFKGEKEYLESLNSKPSPEYVTKTKLIEIFKGLYGKTIIVTFYKKLQESDVVEEIMKIYLESTPVNFRSNIIGGLDNILSGEERTLTGSHRNSVDTFGRYYFEEGVNLKLVDARNLISVEYDNIIYKIK
jgi:hypothetical protein